MDDDTKKEKRRFVASFRNKANEIIICSWQGCTGRAFASIGSGSFECCRCGHVYHVTELDFERWERLG